MRFRAAAASRRHRAVLAGVVTGLLIHFARDIAEAPPGVRMLWPLQDTAWTAGFRWFLGMIIAFTAAQLVLASAASPAGAPVCSGRRPHLVHLLMPRSAA